MTESTHKLYHRPPTRFVYPDRLNAQELERRQEVDHGRYGHCASWHSKESRCAECQESDLSVCQRCEKPMPEPRKAWNRWYCSWECAFDLPEGYDD